MDVIFAGVVAVFVVLWLLPRLGRPEPGSREGHSGWHGGDYPAMQNDERWDR